MFLKQAYNQGICITKVIVVPAFGSVTEYSQLLKNLGNYGVKVALFFGSYVNAVTVLDALERVNNTRSMHYMFTDLNLMETYSSRLAQGATFIGPEMKEVTEFATYFTSLNENSPPVHNPWYKDWYMTHYDCNLNVNYPPFVGKGSCTPLSASQKLANFRQVPYVTSTVKAVYAYAKALREAHKQKCSSFSGTCNGLQQMTTQDFHNNYLKRVNFQVSNMNMS